MMLAMTAAVAVACDLISTEAKLELSETTLSLEAVSGEATFTVTSDQAWEVVTDASWLTLSPASGEASEDAVTVTVTAEENETGDVRNAVITVTAGTIVKTIDVAQAAKQDSAVTMFEADYCEGLYYGDMYSSEQGTYNYFVLLSDNGLADPSDFENYKPNTTYYRLDLYSDTPAEGEGYATIPNGTYQLDIESTYNANTLSAYSRLIVSGDEGGYDDNEKIEIEFTTATVEVTDGKIVLIVTLENGESRGVTFKGDLEIPVYVEEVYEEWTSENLQLAVTDAEIEFYPDEEGGDEAAGTEAGWWLFATDPVTYESATIYLYQAVEATDIVGEFSVKSGPGEGVGFLAGNKDYEGSVWAGYPGAPLADGTITITKEGEVYTITLNCTDGEGHSITGSISGSVVVEEEEE